MHRLVLKYDKLLLMSIRYAPHIRKPDGTLISCKSSMIHLGGVLVHDSKVESNLNRLISMTFEDFNILQTKKASFEKTM